MDVRGLKRQTKIGLYWTLLSQFANYGLQFIIGIVMARLLSPSDYGITALPTVFITIASVFVDSGFANALIRKAEITEEDLSTSFYYSLIVGIVCYTVLFLVSPLIAAFYEIPVLKPLLRVTAISFLWAPLATPQRVILSRQLNFKAPTKISIITRIFGGIIGIILAFTGYGLWALVISNLFSGFISVVMNWCIVKWIPKAPWSIASFKYLWGYGNKLMVSSLIDTTYKNITPVFIGKFYSPSDLGVYNRALSYANLPSLNVTTTIRGVTFPVLSKMQNDDILLANSYRRMLRAICFVVFPMMMFLAGLAKPLVLFMLTEKWAACIPMLQVLCFSQMWYPVDAINLNLLQVKGRSDLFLRLEIIKKVIGLLVLAVTLPIGVIAFCYGSIAYSLFEIVVDSYYTGKMINLGLLKQLKDLMPSLILSFVTFAILLGITHTVSSIILQIGIGIVFGILFYLGTAKLFHFSELKDLKYMLHKSD